MGWSDVAIFRGSRDVAGTSTTFTAADNHGLVRDIREVPVTPGSVLPQQATTALGTAVGFTGGKFNVEAILSIGAIELTTMDGASPAATLLDPARSVRARPTPSRTAPTAVSSLVWTGTTCSRAMEMAFEGNAGQRSHGAAGAPGGGVGVLDLSGICEFAAAGFAGTGANFGAGDLNTLNDGDITIGQAPTTGRPVPRPATHGTTSTMNWPTTRPSSASCRSVASPEACSAHHSKNLLSQAR